MAENTKYLYGAAVQGIQSFIFKTNKLKEIVGASELVERICTDKFNDLIKEYPNAGEVITQAAGNIKILFNSNNVEACQHAVLNFPKKIMEYAPGITISQAVVKVEGELTMDDLNELEKRLKAQRNKPTVDIERGLLITHRSRRTGIPAIKQKDTDYLDAATNAKLFNESKESITSKLSDKVFESDDKYNELFQKNSNELSIGEEHSYIAVIHADGNNLGKIIQSLGENLKKNGNTKSIQSAYSNFSKAIDKATLDAVKLAYAEVFRHNTNPLSIKNGKYYTPFRPIVLSGDDLTVICEARYAMDFTKYFLEKFEETSASQIGIKLEGFELSLDKLTACAGIAFVKNKFPFYYAVELAEKLCGESKRVSKEKLASVNETIKKEEEKLKDVPSSLHFFKVESTFFNSYKEIKERILTKSSVDFCHGPYFVGNSATNHNPKFETIIAQAKLLNKPEAPASQLRKWLNILHKDVNEANALMDRTIQVLKDRKKEETPNYVGGLQLPKKVGKGDITHIYDLVILASLTKESKEEQK